MVEYYREEFVCFNDPDEKEFLDEDDTNPLNYLDETFNEKWTVFSWGALGKPAAFLELWHNTPRYEVWQIIAMNLTQSKLTNRKK